MSSLARMMETLRGRAAAQPGAALLAWLIEVSPPALVVDLNAGGPLWEIALAGAARTSRLVSCLGIARPGTALSAGWDAGSLRPEGAALLRGEAAAMARRVAPGTVDLLVAGGGVSGEPDADAVLRAWMPRLSPAGMILIAGTSGLPEAARGIRAIRLGGERGAALLMPGERAAPALRALSEDEAARARLEDLLGALVRGAGGAGAGGARTDTPERLREETGRSAALQSRLLDAEGRIADLGARLSEAQEGLLHAVRDLETRLQESETARHAAEQLASARGAEIDLRLKELQALTRIALDKGA